MKKISIDYVQDSNYTDIFIERLNADKELKIKSDLMLVEDLMYYLDEYMVQDDCRKLLFSYGKQEFTENERKKLEELFKLMYCVNMVEVR